LPIKLIKVSSFVLFAIEVIDIFHQIFFH